MQTAGQVSCPFAGPSSVGNLGHGRRVSRRVILGTFFATCAVAPMDAPHCQVWSPRDHGFVVCRSLRLDDDSEAAPLQWRGTSRGEARRLVHRPAMRMDGANSRADARSVPRHAGVAVAVIVVAALLLSAIDDNSTPSPIQSRGRGASLLTRRPAMWSACPFPQGSAWDPETRLRRSRTLTLAAAAQAVSSIVDCRTG